MLLAMKTRNVIGVFRYIYCHNLTVDVVVKLSVVYLGIIYKYIILPDAILLWKMQVISLVISLGPVPERSVSVNPGLKFCSVFVLYIPICISYSNILRYHYVSLSKGSTSFCNLKLHVLRQENCA